MTIDLMSMSRRELEKLRTDIDKAIEKLADRDRKAALIAAEKAAAAHGFSLSEITGDGSHKGARRTVSPPKYVNPNDELQTWTGKGRQPEWFKAALAAGVDPDSMEIKN